MALLQRVAFQIHDEKTFGWILIPAWISNYIHYKVFDHITDPLQTSTAVPLLKFVKSNSIPHFTGRVITYLYWD